MATNETQEKIDAALDAALDDLDDDDDDDDDEHQESPPPQTAPPASKPVHGPVPPPQIDPNDMGMAGIDDMMKQLMQGGLGGPDGSGEADEFLGQLLQEMQSQIGDELKNMEQSSPKKKASPKKASPKKASPKKSQQPANSTSSSAAGGGGGESEVDQAIASLVEGMAQQAKLDDPNINSAADGDGMEDEFLKNMMSQLGEGFGGEDGGVNADALIDGVMEELLQKDLMYEPIKKVSEKFPEWLEKNKGKIPEEDYEQ